MLTRSCMGVLVLVVQQRDKASPIVKVELVLDQALRVSLVPSLVDGRVAWFELSTRDTLLRTPILTCCYRANGCVCCGNFCLLVGMVGSSLSHKTCPNRKFAD